MDLSFMTAVETRNSQLEGQRPPTVPSFTAVLFLLLSYLKPEASSLKPEA
jgi:hypothetical protein